MQASEIRRYFERVVDLLESAGGRIVAGPDVDTDWAENNGSLDVTLRFPDDSRLDFAIVAAGPSDYPEILSWRIQFMDGSNETIFRYDDSQHLRGSPNFPSHKHVGPDERAIDCPKPTVADIVRELREHLYPDVS